ncbi:hypothetical protein, partial [Salmonella enterica]|uniref:hypothetical protein n=1 Tax=Salmonella enterica TaxID=28901 RepID=UPI001F1D6B32
NSARRANTGEYHQDRKTLLNGEFELDARNNTVGEERVDDMPGVAGVGWFGLSLSGGWNFY